jgi:hypothetical protein
VSQANIGLLSAAIAVAFSVYALLNRKLWTCIVACLTAATSAVISGLDHDVIGAICASVAMVSWALASVLMATED